MGASMTEITEAEVKAIRWVEHILAPLIVLAVMALGTFAFNAQDTMAQLSADVERYDENNGELKQQVREIHQEQRIIISNQRHIEKNQTEIATHQEHFKKEIDQLQRQSTEILKILRETE